MRYYLSPSQNTSFRGRQCTTLLITLNKDIAGLPRFLQNKSNLAKFYGDKKMEKAKFTYLEVPEYTLEVAQFSNG